MTTTNGKHELESLATRLRTTYPQGYLAGIEVHMPHCLMALRAPVHGLDTPVKILQGSYCELRAFENAFDAYEDEEPEEREIDPSVGMI